MDGSEYGVDMAMKVSFEYPVDASSQLKINISKDGKVVGSLVFCEEQDDGICLDALIETLKDEKSRIKKQEILVKRECDFIKELEIYSCVLDKDYFKKINNEVDNFLSRIFEGKSVKESMCEIDFGFDPNYVEKLNILCRAQDKLLRKSGIKGEV